jgi:voltage-gated potassium channel
MNAMSSRPSRPTGGSRPVDPAPTRGIAGVVYEAVMVALAVLVIALLAQPDEGVYRTINLAIWGVFVVDYLLRLAFSGDRKAFMRRNVIDLIAIMPADVFRAARALRVLRLLRLLRSAAVLWRVSATVRAIMGTNGLSWVLAVTGVVIVLGAGAVLAVEPDMGDFGDALWWSIVTSTTVGYGDLAPETIVGRLVAVVLMVVGIGALGMITGSIATHFIHGRQSPSNPHLDHIRSLLDDWDALSPVHRREAAALLATLANGPDARAEHAEELDPSVREPKGRPLREKS